MQHLINKDQVTKVVVVTDVNCFLQRAHSKSVIMKNDTLIVGWSKAAN